MLKLIAIGNIGKDAEVKDINGNKLIDFSIAHTERYTSNGTQQEKTTWVRCSYWTEKTTIAQYLKKGTQVYVEGTPSSHAYTNKEGVNTADLRLRVISIQLLGSRSNTASANPNETSQNSNAANSFNDDDIKDDLPF